jgi:double-stranded uracil-DNA glycosylase
MKLDQTSADGSSVQKPRADSLTLMVQRRNSSTTGQRMTKEGFDPIAGKTVNVLILGTFPSEESLKQKQYYAHPRNLFWDMIAAICETGKVDDYKKRCDLVKSEGIAIWDVLKSCDREGSSDGQIRRGHFIINDIYSFISEHPVKVIIFNGKKAAILFKQYVEPAIFPSRPRMLIMPSTSPANATLSKQQKMERWLEVKTYLTTFN